MEKKATLITGAAGGIGIALCRQFSLAGYRVIATDIKASPDLKCDAFIELDLETIVFSEDKLEKFKKSIVSSLDDSELTTLVNNAATQVLSVTEKITRDDWARTLNVNLTAPFLLIQKFLPWLEQNRGSVINISSVHADATKPEFVSYATSKAALRGLTQSLAVDLGSRIRVNAINPAATATEMLLAGFEKNPGGYNELNKMHPIGRIAEPDEIARVAVFLASEDASFITGASINVDGGISARLHDPE